MDRRYSELKRNYQLDPEKWGTAFDLYTQKIQQNYWLSFIFYINIEYGGAASISSWPEASLSGGHINLWLSLSEGKLMSMSREIEVTMSNGLEYSTTE